MLWGAEPGPAFDHLADSDRAAILEILLDTDPAFAAAQLTRDGPR